MMSYSDYRATTRACSPRSADRCRLTHPPSDSTAERALVSLALTTLGEAYDVASATVRPESFYGLAEGRCWQAIGAMRSVGEVPTVFALEHALKGRVASEDVLALDALIYDPASLPRWTRIVVELAQRRAIIRACQSAAAMASDASTDTTTMVKGAEALLYSALRTYQTHKAYAPMAETVEAVKCENAFAAAERGRLLGIGTGIPSLDDVLRGLRPGELMVIGGRTSEGKSSLALTIARHNAMPARGKRTAYFSCEMTREDLVRRLVAGEGVTLSDQESFDFYQNAKNVGLLRDAYAEVAAYPIEVVYQPAITFSQVRTYLRRFATTAPVDIVMLDYLGIMGTDTKAERRDLDVSNFVNESLAIAAEFGCPVIAIQGLNRKSAHDGKLQRPQISHLMDSSAIEYGAHHVLLVHNPNAKIDGDDTDDTGDRDIIIAKNRRGPKNRTVKTRFLPRKFLFTEGSTRDQEF